jgi:hypothetical protein
MNLLVAEIIPLEWEDIDGVLFHTRNEVYYGHTHTAVGNMMVTVGHNNIT